MPVHYAGSRYALSRFCKHYAYYVASHVRDYTAWEVIPPPAVDEACRLAKDEAALAVEQDCTVVWSSPARSSLEPPRLRLTAAARERVRKHSNTMAYSSQVVMPEVIGNKRAGPALRDGTVLCPQWNQGLCVNGDACPVAHRCAAVYRSGRVCGGHHPALECRSPKVQWVNVHTTPAPKPPARKRGGTAELQVQMRALSRSEPDWRRILEGHPGSTDGSIGPVPKLGVSRPNLVQLNLAPAASEVPRSSASVTHTKSAALCRPAIQCTTTQSPCHKVRAMMPKTSPQSRAKSSGLLKETTSSRAPCRVTPFLASGAWPKAESCKATCP